MEFQAHKGVSTESPENTMPSVIYAYEQGYSAVEIDLGVTSDGVFVLLHDSTVNRTARNKDGSPLSHPVSISDITYAEALEYDFGAFFSCKFCGTRIPLFEQVLSYAQERDLQLKIDNKYQRFSPEQKERLFELIAPYQSVACLTCNDADELISVSKRFPRMHLHYDGEVSGQILDRLSEALDGERLTVWLPLRCRATDWVKVAYADKELAERVKRSFRLGLWILSSKEQLIEAELLGADVIETNGELKPERKGLRFADMHTHSQSSHDSVCPIEEMMLAEEKRGASFFAVTDHFDTASYNDYDVFTPIKKAEETVKELNSRYNGRTFVLFGIEISEGFWHPEIYSRIRAFADYDTVIGSVHLTRFPSRATAYSRLDFSEFGKDEVLDYLDRYFDDVLEMLAFAEMDILAHLTCPLRYISGKYGILADMSRYDVKIDKILSTVIKKGIALEVNTSSLGVLGEYMPSLDILKRYREMGGYMITLGSDAHIAENAAIGFERAVEDIKKIGFDSIFYFKNRVPYQISI